ncbi:putative small GTPase superfamily, ARF/SAR type, P-loop containing nucleoside triphosphate hydrolase [Helianthus annuus]|nr:putative small GTPase superfamily, ARF/SAR type, P-loop containing nucleoside triphosphate hydrolase [Helianthus annuus]KAJ0707881.1 putative small GTPase superfamily, ARF/SAR type, P-loop containing nucleoside triphosphate hydrolase [Helianthus annuus]KAJ0711859.1 putative small GTPase superfamily, ARF/SAR type, P-loop containing nucleoside triphosphate hydrolase [Helianthus annuus]
MILMGLKSKHVCENAHPVWKLNNCSSLLCTVHKCFCVYRHFRVYTLNIWDVGGQKTIRSYWRNYFEQTDGLVWVVDSSDLRRLDDCKFELDNLLKEERLSGASLLVFANKQDIQGALSPEEIAKVSLSLLKKRAF